jgi:hypothetical protein
MQNKLTFHKLSEVPQDLHRSTNPTVLGLSIAYTRGLSESNASKGVQFNQHRENVSYLFHLACKVFLTLK